MIFYRSVKYSTTVDLKLAGKKSCIETTFNNSKKFSVTSTGLKPFSSLLIFNFKNLNTILDASKSIT